MSKIKILSFKKALIFDLSKFCLFLSLAVLAPLLKQQFLTGTIVNALLFLSVVSLGIRGALLLAICPSVFAFYIGLLAPAMAPFIPLIVLSNMALVLVFNLLKKNNFWLGMVSAAVLKFIFLAGASSFLAHLFIKKEAILPILTMLSWPQLFTALAGGLLAYLVLKNFKKNNAQ